LRAEIWLEIEEAESDPPERPARTTASAECYQLTEGSKSLLVPLRMTWKSGETGKGQLEDERGSPKSETTYRR